MGIKNLKALLKKHAPGSITSINLESLRGSKICIDSSILLYKYRYIYLGDNFHVVGFLNKILELMNYDIIPIFIFDGKPPDAKMDILKKRKELKIKNEEKLEQLKEKLNFVLPPNLFINSDSDDDTSGNAEEVKEFNTVLKEIEKLEKNSKNINKKHSLELMELFETLGVPFLQAPGEAEQLCAYLQKNGKVDYILTEDTDCLTFGGSNILFTKGRDYFLCSLEIILEKLSLTLNEFVDLCILCGCDYTSTIPGIGPVKAYTYIKKHRNIENFENVPDSFNYQLARNLFKEHNFEIELNEIKINKNLITLKLNSIKNNF